MTHAAVWTGICGRFKTLDRGEVGDRGEGRDVRRRRVTKGGSVAGYGLVSKRVLSEPTKSKLVGYRKIA